MAYSFVNPYSFFPLSEKKQEAQEPNSQGISGVIQYTVFTKTPLFIPDSEQSFCEIVTVEKSNRTEKEEHLHSVFISRNDLSSKKGEVVELSDTAITQPQSPFIPGSEVRGLFRSVYEMLTDSCFSTLDDDELLSKRTHEVFSAGLIKKIGENRFGLYKADDCIFRADQTGSINDAPPSAYGLNPRNGRIEYKDYRTKSYKIDIDRHPEFKDGQKVFLQTTRRPRGKTIAKHLSTERTYDSPVEGYLMKGLEGPDMGGNAKNAKHNCHIFVLDRTAAPVEVDLQILDDVLHIYKENEVNTYSEYARSYAAFKNGETGAYFPVYYSMITEINKIYLSPAATTREIYTRRIKDAVHGMTPCNGKDKLCPACRLFGTVKTEHAVSSRIRFSDLSFVDSKREDHRPDYTGAMTLIPLSAPKISNMEFYLQRPAPDAVFWTYDYYIDVNGRIHANTSGINGRKFYWNHAGQVLTTQIKSDQNRTVYPLNAGNTFKGELYFNNITAAELEKLVFILNCGETDDVLLQDRTHCYKLGAGKPAGLGSIAVKVDAVYSRELSTDGIYSVNPHHVTGEHNLKHLEQFAKMTGFISENVDYPRETPNGDIFAWYSNNHRGYRYDSRSGQNIKTNSPNSRKQEYFGQYLIPLETQLGQIPMPGSSSSQTDSATDNYSHGNGGGYRQAPQHGEKKEQTSAANHTAAECISCHNPVKINPLTQRPYPLCQNCNNDKVTATCLKCGKSFNTPRYYAKRNSVCPECRKK